MAVSIEWDMGDGTTSQASAPTHIFTEPGDYTVQLVALGPCSTDTATALVTVLPGPVASFSGPDTLCLGEAAAFFDQSELATGIEWDMGDGTTLQSSSPVHMFTEPGPYTVQLVASGPCFNDTATMVVTVLPLSVASFIGPDSLCLGEVANFFDQSEMAEMIEWDMGDGTTSQASAPTHLFSEPGSYTVSLVATGSCLTDTATALVTVLSQAVASFSVSSDTCDLRIVLAATGSDDAALIWDLGDGTTSQSSLLAHSYAASGTYQVTLVAFGSGMCADTATVFIEVGMAVEGRPEITVGCDGMVVMQDMIGTAATWDWSLGDGGTATSDSLAHAYAAPGTYEVTLVVGNGDACSSTYVLPVTVPPFPQAGFEVHPDPCSPALRFIDTSLYAMAHVWHFGEGTTTTGPQPVHHYPDNGTYTVWLTITGADGCMDSTSQQVVVDGTHVPGEWSLPNCFTPNGDGSNDLFVVGLPAGCGTGPLRIFNRWGRMVFETDTLRPWDGTIGGSAVPEGVYMYVLELDGRHYSGHVTVLR